MVTEPGDRALTAAERLHLEVLGYVVVEGVLSSAETRALHDKVLEMEADHRTGGPIRASSGERPHFYTVATDELFRIDNLPHVDPLFFDYLTHPRLVAMAEEAIGGQARLEQSDAHVHHAVKDLGAWRYSFHRGGFDGFDFTIDGRYHCPFVKTLTNLTDLGPDDGGTTVIAGSHKLLDRHVGAAIHGALSDPKRSLIHQVVAPAGSTLVFFESLLHSSGRPTSGRDRVLVLGGYTPHLYQPWEGYDPDPALADGLSPEHHALLFGTKRLGWRPSRRPLGDV